MPKSAVPTVKNASVDRPDEIPDDEKTLPPLPPSKGGLAPAAPPAAAPSSMRAWVLVGLGLVVGLGVVGWTVRDRLRPSGPAVTEIKELPLPPPQVDLSALVARLEALDKRFGDAAAEGKNMQTLVDEAKALRTEMAQGDASKVELRVRELESGLGY